MKPFASPADIRCSVIGQGGASMTGQAELVISPEWSRRTLQILALATESARLNRTVGAWAVFPGNCCNLSGSLVESVDEPAFAPDRISP